MAYASQSGRARTSAKSPQAFAVCQRCGIWYNRVDLQFQFQWRGASLINTFKLVCKPCLDIPQEQLRAIVLPADPVPIFYPSVEDFEQDETDYRAASTPTVIDPIVGIPIPSDELRVTLDCQNRTTYPFGRPVGLTQNAVMPYNGGVQRHYGVPLELLSVTSDGTTTVSVTCSAVHNLRQNEILSDQVSIAGLANPAADGFYSVNVITATAFTYSLYGSIPAQGLLTPTTRAVTCLVGLPLGYKRIPKIYGPTLLPEVEAEVCFFELEDGTGMFMLEDGSGFLQIEQCAPPTTVCFLGLEIGIGMFALENGGGFIQLEQCMQTPTDDFFFGLESGVGSILLENNVDFLEQEDGP